MASLDDLKLSYRLFMRNYPYRKVDWGQGAVLRRPLNECRLAVVTTAALHLPSQKAFDEGIRGGDWSYREIPVGCNLDSLRMAHKSDAFDHTGVESDKNLAMPLDRLRELVEAGFLGGLTETHYSFMGSITAPGRLIEESAPEVARLLGQQQADAVLLTPV